MTRERTDSYIAALHALAEGGCTEHVQKACESAAKNMGLVHSLKDLKPFDADVPVLLSPERLGLKVPKARLFAGTQNDVFFFVGPPMKNAQPERQAFLLFSANIESTEMVATPWDSGGLHRRRAQHLTETDRQSLLQNRTMSAPDYRRALATTLLLRFNGVANNYLDCCIIDSRDPDGVYEEGEPSSFTYEVRVPGELALQVKELALVAIRREYAMHEGVRRFRRWCIENSVEFVVVDEQTSKGCARDVVVDFAKSLMVKSLMV